jgi:transcriptional repressor NrdR
LSEVAYIRFASVYRQFRGIRDFIDTLNHLQGCLNQGESANEAVEDRVDAEAGADAGSEEETPASFVAHS